MPTPRPLALAVSLVATATALNAHADQAEELSTLTVTGTAATKTETPFTETPQATSRVDREEWEQKGAETVQRALDYTPGAFTNQIGSSNRYDYIVLRGFTDGSVSNTFLDGLKLMGDAGTFSSLKIDPYMLESMEVVKGPASVLYGRASPGGLVSLTSKRPEFTEEVTGEVMAGYGNRNQYQAGFDVTGSLDDSQRAAFRLTGIARGGETQFEPVEEESYAIAPSLTWDITDQTTLNLNAYISREPEGGYHAGLPYEGTVSSRFGRHIDNDTFEGEPDHDKFERDQNLLGYELEHRFTDDLTARQKVRYLESDVTNHQGYISALKDGSPAWASDTELYRGYLESEESLEAWTVDNQLEFSLDTGDVNHQLLFGADYQYRQTDTEDAYGALTPIDVFDPQYGATPTGVTTYFKKDRELEQIGTYFQDQINWGNWHAMVGGRHDWVEIDNVERLNDTENSREDTQFSGRAGLLYSFDNGVSPFINYTTSFSPNSLSKDDGTILEPTEGEQIETGIKYQPNGTSDQYSLTAFHITQENVATKENPDAEYETIGEIQSQGIELEARIQLANDFSVHAGYAYTDATFEDTNNSYEGQQVNSVPEQTATLWGFYDASGGPLRGLDAGLGVRYYAESYADRDNTEEVPSYTLLDGMIGYDFSEVGLEGVTGKLNVNNMLDEDYVASCNSISYCYFGAERSIKATVSYDF
ncbi:TonB-dependent siderophore receptor [Halomonas koreensis]|uniref:TonB-dependent siderophore receptor n=1 Tax=Halomonas koreensis TaxID=245385 RepID=A0ABU1G389_9GAMM|nr:TonB-dependent siderophore receptor [Halomonas koreensis]MDR5867397.1 TonB-dependent siderophore receptor [Halomonas koreensis]